jgi:anti-anti-sigma factor
MTFIDSQGIKVFVEAYKRAPPGRASRVVLRSPRAQARTVLELTGLADRLPIED